jgi:hypothetical protein
VAAGRQVPAFDKEIPETPKGMNKTKIVIAGGGFAGLAAATYLNRGRELTVSLRLVTATESSIDARFSEMQRQRPGPSSASNPFEKEEMYPFCQLRRQGGMAETVTRMQLTKSTHLYFSQSRSRPTFNRKPQLL